MEVHDVEVVLKLLYSSGVWGAGEGFVSACALGSVGCVASNIEIFM
jgi:hypothetical protein